MFNDWVYRRFPQCNADGDAGDIAAVKTEFIKHCIPSGTVTVDIPLSKLHHNFEEMEYAFVGLGQ
jgi:hypothetical protein